MSSERMPFGVLVQKRRKALGLTQKEHEKMATKQVLTEAQIKDLERTADRARSWLDAESIRLVTNTIREREDRIAALQAALSKTWAHNYGASHVRCGVCLRTAMHDEEYIEHKPGCIVLTLPKEENA
jgi:hypothetical protein